MPEMDGYELNKYKLVCEYFAYSWVIDLWGQLRPGLHVSGPTAEDLNTDHLFSIITFCRFEATKQIRQTKMRANEERKNKLVLTEGSTFVEYHLRVLAMTTDVIRATYEECIKFGMNGYVSKPFDEE
jgi:hypothetical protein